VGAASAAGFSNVAEADAGNCDANAEDDGPSSDWQETVQDALPGAEKERQKIFVNAQGIVTVRVCWLDRSVGGYHNHVVAAQINKNE
jgi:hypothetical protein